MNKGTVRTRFAPSPTGYMHVGNLRTALYTYLIAKQNDGTFILRIEDTDQERYVDGAIDIIYNTLKETGLLWDEGPDVGGPVGPYIQSEREDIYEDYAKQLIESGHAYYCFCDKERLEELRKIQTASGMAPKYDGHCSRLSKEEIEAKLAAGTPYVIRQKIPAEGSTTFSDEVFGDITVDNSDLDDGILIKTDKMPTYNFANVIDDHLMGITHVVRGSEYLSSAPKYNLLYTAFGWDIPKYVHCPPVMKDAQRKLSKRLGDASYEDLIAKGYLTEGVINYIALCGWSPGGEEEIFSLNDLVKVFNIAGISKSPAIFDTDKLNYINSEWLKRLSEEEFYERALPWIKKGVKREDIDFHFLAGLLKTRCDYFGEIPPQLEFVDEMSDYDTAMFTHKKMKTTPETSLETLKKLLPVMEGIDNWTFDNIHDTIFAFIKEEGLKNGAVLWPLRVAITGQQFTPGGGTDAAYLLGKEDTLARMKRSIEKLQA